MHEITILLVEDDFLNRRLIKRVFVDKGYKVLEAKNAEETRAILANEKVNLLILDINLGENQQDGISLGNYLKHKYQIPFIYLTAYQTTDIIHSALNSFPQSYLTKPFKNADLIASVALALQRSESRDENLPYIILKDDEYSIKVPLERIDYIESEGNYLLVHSDSKVYKCRSTIKKILETLPQTTFIQTHRAYIINKDKIEMYSLKNVIIKNTPIPVSKNYMNDVHTVYESVI
jgi:DNA-binding LytR/AlgR family response regulator